MKRVIKASSDKFAEMQQNLEREAEDFDPIYEQTSAGYYFMAMDLAALDSLGWECEASVQGGEGTVDFWSKEEGFPGYDETIKYDFDGLDNAIIDDALEASSEEDFKQRRKKWYASILGL